MRRRVWPYLVVAGVLAAACSPATPKPTKEPPPPTQTGPFTVRFIAAVYGENGLSYDWWKGDGRDPKIHNKGQTTEATYTTAAVRADDVKSVSIHVDAAPPSPISKVQVYARCIIQRVLDDGTTLVQLTATPDNVRNQHVECKYNIPDALTP